MEWIFKAPKHVDITSIRRLSSEIATLKFVNKLASIPAPRIYDYSTIRENPATTPYILMDKIRGVTLFQALAYGCIGRQGVHQVLEGLAEMRKAFHQHPFKEVGSLVLDWDEADQHMLDDGKLPPAKSEIGFFVAQLINKWACDILPGRYHSGCWDDALEYYYEQHNLSLVGGIMDGEKHEKTDKWLAHQYLGSLLPSYTQDSPAFYLAHTDLSLSNIMVDPSDGAFTGIIDWEFANTLPPQAAEQYPTFLVDGDGFVKRYSRFDNPSAELDEWRAHYANQFDDEETVNLHNRIDTIIEF